MVEGVLVFERGCKQSKPPTATAECDRADELETNAAQFGRKMEDDRRKFLRKCFSRVVSPSNSQAKL